MLKNGRLVYKRFDSFPKVINSISTVRHSRVEFRPEKNVNGSPKEVIIPPRIERGPTDVLKALASTVEVDPTAFEYKYPDDPHFYPYTLSQKKVLALSLESGRKSAKWIIENNPAFFKHQLSDPPVKAFIPTSLENSEAELTEHTLINLIKRRNVLKAIEVFKELKQKNFELLESTKQCLLELVCFYNCDDKPKEELEKKWFSDSDFSAVPINTWKNNDFAEELFSTMDSSCPLANSAIIQGMFKYNEIYKAFAFFKEARAKKIKLPIDAYNAYLSKIHILGGENVAYPIKEMFRVMSQDKITPNLGTLNSALETLYSSKYFYDKPRTALQILREFEDLGIKPSLGSFGLLFAIIANSVKGPDNEYAPLMQCIMNNIENENHEILHPSDLNFFVCSMGAFCDMRSNLALQLDKMLWKNNNNKFITNNTDQCLYFKKLFFFLFNTKPIDFAMQVYRKYINMFGAGDNKITKVIIEAITENYAVEHLPTLWEYTERTNANFNRPSLRLILSLIRTFSDDSSLKIFHKAAISLLEKSEVEEIFLEDSKTISFLLMAFVKNDDEERTLKLMQIFKGNLELIALGPKEIETVFEYAVLKKNSSLIRSFLSLAFDVEHSKIDQMVEKSLPLLNEQDKDWVDELLKQGKKEKSKKKKKKEKTFDF